MTFVVVVERNSEWLLDDYNSGEYGSEDPYESGSEDPYNFIYDTYETASDMYSNYHDTDTYDPANDEDSYDSYDYNSGDYEHNDDWYTDYYTTYVYQEEFEIDTWYVDTENQLSEECADYIYMTLDIQLGDGEWEPVWNQRYESDYEMSVANY